MPNTMAPSIINGNEPELANPKPMARMRRWLGRALAAAVLQVLAVQANAASYAFAQLAGDGSVLDQTNGTGSNARFFNPTGVAVDGSGNVYVADGGDHTIRKIAAGGVVTTWDGENAAKGGRIIAAGDRALYEAARRLLLEG